MFVLLAPSAIAAAAVVGSMFDLFSSNDDVEGSLENIDDADGFDLLEADLLDDLQNSVLMDIEDDATVADEEAVRDENTPTGPIGILGTDGNDFLDARADVFLSFGEDGNDVIFGADHNQVIFGGAGDDLAFAEGGVDQVSGDDGDDLLFGGDGGDLLIGGTGTDTIFGGAGDDTIFTAAGGTAMNDPETFEIAAGGEGDDKIHVGFGTALLEWGAGADDVLVLSEGQAEGDNPLAVITDFDPAEDQIVLGVYAPDFEFEGDANSLEISYTLTEIETSQGLATLIVPAVENVDLQAALAGANVGHAILIGVTPEQIQENDIKVLIDSSTSSAFAPDSIQQIFKGQSVGAGI